MTLPVVIVVAMQPRVGADGGTASIGEIITRLRHYRPIVVADRESRKIAKWRESGIEVHVVPQSASGGFFTHPLGTIRTYLRYFRKLRSLIETSGAKIVHANDPLALQLSLMPVRSTGTPLAFNLRDTIDPARRPPFIRYRFLFAAVDHVFYLSRDMADRWAKIAPNAKRACTVTYSIVDPMTFGPTPIPTDGRPAVLLSGLIRPKKGQLEFLKFVAPALAANGISTWLASDFEPSQNRYMAACAKAAAGLGDAVKFLGYRTDVPDLMSRSSVIAISSRYEGLVRAMIEGMSSGRPVVSFDICSARELLETESASAGRVVDVGDYEGMAEAIIDYCRNRDLATAAGNSGYATALRLFAPDKVVARYESVYDTLNAAHAPAARG